MKKYFDSNTPIYLQIVDEIKKLIVTGKLESGQRVASVRELATDFSVNPNTMQRALTELEREGYLHAERTNGRYVTDNKDIIKEGKHTMIKAKVDAFVREMESLGYTREDIIELIKGGEHDGK